MASDDKVEKYKELILLVHKGLSGILRSENVGSPVYNEIAAVVYLMETQMRRIGE